MDSSSVRPERCPRCGGHIRLHRQSVPTLDTPLTTELAQWECADQQRCGWPAD